MNESIEIEARWINLSRNAIEKKLRELGAEKISDSFFREWIFHYGEENKDWTEKRKRVRVRDDGKTVWMTYKANPSPTWGVDTTEEIELEVPSADDAKKFIEKIGIPLRRYQEKKRIKYKLGDAYLDLDFWPKIPMVLEIEAPSKKEVMRVAGLLGLKWEDAIFVDQKWVHKDYYGIDFDEMREYRF